jgi:TP901 family phage tail tape measure protein
MGKLAIGAGVAAVGVGIAIATKQYIEFDDAITAATAKFKDLDVTSDTYAESLRRAGQAARDVAAVTEYNAVDTAGALDKMAMAGLSSEQAMSLLMGTTNLATAAGMDLTTAVDIATDSLGAFGLMTDDAAQLSTNLDRVSDVMARTTNMFNTDMPGMFEAIKKGGPAFTSAGQSMEDFSALIGAMASSGVKGSEAGTQLRNMMLSLANPSDKAATALENMGITVKDQSGNFLNVIDIIGQFERATASMGTAEKAAALATIFGSRTVTGMNILLQEGSERLRGYRTELVNAGGAAANIAEAMRGSIKNKIEVLKSALTELGFKFVESFQEKGVGLIEKLTEAISQFDPQPIIDGFTTVASIIGSVIGTLWNMRDIILGVAIAWGIYKAAMLAAVLIGPIIGMIKAVQALMAAQHGMNAATALFNVLLNMNPIGLIITAIGVLIGLFILAYNKIEPFRNAVNGIFEKIKEFAAHLMNVFAPVMETIRGVIDKVKNVFSEIFGTVGRVIGLFFDLFNITGTASGGFSFLDGILKVFSTTVNIVWTLIGGLVDIFGALFQGVNDVFDAFKNGGFLAGIKQIGASLLSYILSPIEAILNAVSWIPGIGDLAKGAAEKIGSFRESLRYQPPEAEAAANPAPAANTATPSQVTQSAAGTPPASPALTPSPATSTTTGTLAPQAPGAVRQPALLNLSPAASPQTASVAPAASTWMVPATVTGGVEDVTPPALAVAPAVTRTVTAGVSPAPVTTTAPTRAASPAPAASPVRIPVEYIFPEMTVPPEIIKAISVPVEWAFSTTLPPARAGRTVPPVRPISGSVEQGLTPLEPPMTQAEQIIYSRTDNYENVRVELVPEEGIAARVVKGPKSPNVRVVVSGDA